MTPSRWPGAVRPPGVEVICRDRASAYADGARTGAPDAVQVADRFHLWQNLAKAVEKCAAAHCGCLAEPAPAARAAGDGAPDATAGRARRPGRRGGTGARREVRRARQAEPGPGPPAAGRGTRHPGDRPAPGLGTAHRPALRPCRDLAGNRRRTLEGRARTSKLDPFKPYLDQHHDGGHGSITRLFREIRAIGYDGSYPVVRDYLSAPACQGAAAAGPATVRDVTNWLTRHPGSLTEELRPRLKAILDRCPELQAASDQVAPSPP